MCCVLGGIAQCGKELSVGLPPPHMPNSSVVYHWVGLFGITLQPVPAGDLLQADTFLNLQSLSDIVTIHFFMYIGYCDYFPNSQSQFQYCSLIAL